MATALGPPTIGTSIFELVLHELPSDVFRSVLVRHITSDRGNCSYYGNETPATMFEHGYTVARENAVRLSNLRFVNRACHARLSVLLGPGFTSLADHLELLLRQGDVNEFERWNYPIFRSVETEVPRRANWEIGRRVRDTEGVLCRGLAHRSQLEHVYASSYDQLLFGIARNKRVLDFLPALLRILSGHAHEVQRGAHLCGTRGFWLGLVHGATAAADATDASRIVRFVLASCYHLSSFRRAPGDEAIGDLLGYSVETFFAGQNERLTESVLRDKGESLGALFNYVYENMLDADVFLDSAVNWHYFAMHGGPRLAHQSIAASWPRMLAPVHAHRVGPEAVRTMTSWLLRLPPYSVELRRYFTSVFCRLLGPAHFDRILFWTGPSLKTRLLSQIAFGPESDFLHDIIGARVPYLAEILERMTAFVGAELRPDVIQSARIAWALVSPTDEGVAWAAARLTDDNAPRVRDIVCGAAQRELPFARVGVRVTVKTARLLAELCYNVGAFCASGPFRAQIIQCVVGFHPSCAADAIFALLKEPAFDALFGSHWWRWAVAGPGLGPCTVSTGCAPFVAACVDRRLSMLECDSPWTIFDEAWDAIFFLRLAHYTNIAGFSAFDDYIKRFAHFGPAMLRRLLASVVNALCVRSSVWRFPVQFPCWQRAVNAFIPDCEHFMVGYLIMDSLGVDDKCCYNNSIDRLCRVVKERVAYLRDKAGFAPPVITPRPLESDSDSDSDSDAADRESESEGERGSGSGDDDEDEDGGVLYYF
jgi:hypothetical protein